MILTLTPNPTIDRVLFVRGFRTGAVVRAEREVVTPSGKGVGASLVISDVTAAYRRAFRATPTPVFCAALAALDWLPCWTLQVMPCVRECGAYQTYSR